MSDLTPHTTSIVQRMFIETADQNYILARIAYFNGLDIDFYWLSLHAIEKYLKATLLLNGQSAKKHSHDIVKLHAAAMTLHPNIAFGPLVNPEQIPNLVWRDTTVEQFIARLNLFGDPNNRYLAYGYNIMLDDLVKVDQLIWSIRRHCRLLRDTFEAGDRIINIDEVEILRRQPERWKLGGFLPIEVLLEDKRREHQKNAFLRLNIPFAPSMDHHLPGSGLWSASSNPPLVNEFEILQTADASPQAQAEAAAVFKWVLANVECGTVVRREIQAALEAYQKKGGQPQ